MKAMSPLTRGVLCYYTPEGSLQTIRVVEKRKLKKQIIGAVKALSGALLALTFLVAPGPAWAISRSELIVLPVTGEVADFSVASPATAIKLDFGVEYAFEASWTGLPGSFFNNGTDANAEVEPFDMSFNLLAMPSAASPTKTYKLVFVITSLRSDVPNAPDPDFPPRVDAGFVPNSFLGPGGSPPLTTLFVSDANPGQINQKEGDLFLAIEFSQAVGATQNGSFEIGFLAPIPGTSFEFFHSAFLVQESVPEPATGVLTLLALGGLLLRRFR